MWTPIALSLETLAWIIIVLFAVKMLVLLIKPSGWLSIVEKIYALPVITVIVEVVLAYIVLTSLLALGITYVEILAVSLLVTLLMGLSLAVYSNEMIALGKKLLQSKSFWKKAWLPVLIWVFLVVMALNEMFGWFTAF